MPAPSPNSRSPEDVARKSTEACPNIFMLGVNKLEYAVQSRQRICAANDNAQNHVIPKRNDHERLFVDTKSIVPQ